jgi:hypothetical protein
MAASYATVSAKLGKVQAATKSISKEIYDEAKKAGHEIWYMWGMGSSSEHATGRALDFMVRNEAAGDWIRNYIWKNRQRLRLQHVIWEQHITSTVTQPGVRRKMADRGSVTENHMDHVHVLFFSGSYKKPSSGSGSTSPGKKSNTEVAKEIVAGKGGWGNNPVRFQRLAEAGYEPSAVQLEVEKLMDKEAPPRKSIGQIAGEVIARKWGDGDERKRKLEAAGYNYAAVQKEVNRLLTPKGEKKPKLTVAQVAKQVIDGKWGDGADRKSRLIRAGYNYNAIQAEVNRRFR